MKERARQVLTPRQIVEELDRYIIGQDEAKRAVAVALRNRWRRRQLPEDLQREIYPKNILMIGPTGVGKTEIARRLARLAGAPFVKVEASKFTEVGYVGRDVESMVRDLMELSVSLVKAEHQVRVMERAETLAEERLLDLLFPEPPVSARPDAPPEEREELRRRREANRESFRQKLRAGALDDRFVELEKRQSFGGMLEIFSSSGIEEVGMNLRNSMPGLFQGKVQRTKMQVSEARTFLAQEEAEKLLDMDKVIQEAIERVEQTGLLFIDEIDKVAGREGGHGPEVSREGVQRDLLPIVEGSPVTTKYGVVRTDHILFIAAGAFNVSRPSELIPELQGRFPIRVDVQPLKQEDLARILEEPKNSLIKQYTALLDTEEVQITFSPDAIQEIARLAQGMNQDSVDIGARRLHTLMESLLQELSFHAPELPGTGVEITAEYVRERIDMPALLAAEDVRKRRRPGFRT